MRSIVLICAMCSVMACSDTRHPLEPATALIQEANLERRPERGEILADSPVRADLAAVRRATAFHDPAVAAAAGYLINEPCQESAAGAMGLHAPHPALVRDGIVDPLRPDVLLYLPQEDGTWRLIGLEYMQFVTVRDPVTQVVAPWRSPAKWPSNYEVVTETPTLFGQPFQGPMAGHSATMPWHWDLHVWLWAHNPSGMFAQWNPTLQCGA